MRVGQAFGSALREARNRRGFTLEELADRCAELNEGDRLGLDKARLSRIERGGEKRSVRLDQWLLLAAALDVPPLLLVVPLGRQESIEITASSRIHPDLAMQWLMGETTLASTRQRSIGLRHWHRMRMPLQLHEDLRRAQESVEVDQPHRPDESPTTADAYRGLADALQAFAEHGMRPPAMSPWVYARLVEHGRHPAAFGVEMWTPDHWYEEYGEPVAMRHPMLDEPVLIAGDFVEGYANGLWEVVE